MMKGAVMGKNRELGGKKTWENVRMEEGIG